MNVFIQERMSKIFRSGFLGINLRYILGVLILNLTRDTYHHLGIHGRPSVFKDTDKFGKFLQNYFRSVR